MLTSVKYLMVYKNGTRCVIRWFENKTMGILLEGGNIRAILALSTSLVRQWDEAAIYSSHVPDGTPFGPLRQR